MICGNCGHSVSALFPNGNCIECNSGGAKLVLFTPPTKFSPPAKSEAEDHQRSAREHIAETHAKRAIRRRRGFE